MERHPFTPTAFFIWSGLLIWLLNFLFVYVFAALACAHGFFVARVLGIGIIPFVTTLSSVLAGISTGVVSWKTLQRMRSERDADSHSQFIRFLIVAAGALALVALVWVALPPLLLSVRC